MSVEVVMPQMGESITEGTVSKWLKQVGDKDRKRRADLEISTDKVDAEVPSPSAGILLEIRAKEGETVEVGTVVAVFGEEGEASRRVAKSASFASQHSRLKNTAPVAEERAEPICRNRAEQQPATANSVDKHRTTRNSQTLKTRRKS